MAEFDANFMQGPMDDVGMVKFSGSIERVIYTNDENGYAICDLGTDTDELVTITGTLPYIGEGATLRKLRLCARATVRFSLSITPFLHPAFKIRCRSGRI